MPLSPAVVALLRKHKHRAEAPNGWRAANQWTDTGLVFTTEFGAPVDPRNLLRTIQAAACRLRVSRGRRCAHIASLCGGGRGLEAGVHIPARSAHRPGHSAGGDHR